jgi:hypothetical protein
MQMHDTQRKSLRGYATAFRMQANAHPASVSRRIYTMALDTVMFVFMETAADIAMCRPGIIDDDKDSTRDRNTIVHDESCLSSHNTAAQR